MKNMGFCALSLAGLLFFSAQTIAEDKNLLQLPVKVLTGVGGEEYSILPLELKATSVVQVIGGRNRVALEVATDGHVRVVRVEGSLTCSVPVRDKNMVFQVMPGQRIMIWPISKIRFVLDEDRLSVEFTAPGWAVALLVEYSGPTGVEINFDGKMGQLYTDQRADTLLGVDGQVMLVRSSGVRTTTLTPTPVPAPIPVPTPVPTPEKPKTPVVSVRTPYVVTEEEGAILEPLPDAVAAPGGWYPQQRWTELPFLPITFEPGRPVEVSP